MSAEAQRPAGSDPGETGLTKGATIGRYVVLGLLGRGGMGEVYAAYDPELDRKIAVKLLRARGGAGQSDADGRTRLLREAQAIARLSHPNVVVVYDVGTFRESVFIAMEFVEGHTLGYWLQAAPRRWREVLDVYLAAGRGLAAAHAAGLVHRDFKPENVMITKGGQVRVMDFGLARDQNGEDGPPPASQLALGVAARAAALADTFGSDVDPDATAKLGTGGTTNQPVPAGSGGYLRLKLTQTGAMLGTPAYMAPEQFAGIGGDARADQFSFCVALYEGIYGRRPFAGDNAVALMANAVAGAVTDPPPDARVPAWIRKILLRGLSHDPKQRFASMTELLAALSHDPAARRRRSLSAIAAAGLIAAGAVGAHRFSSNQHAICAGGPGRAAAAWSSGRRGAIERAFLATGNKDAARAFANASALVDRYLARWTEMYTDTCEATQVRGEQSAEVLDLRMGCLNERLASVRTLGDVLVTADGGVVDNAVAAASALPALDRCSDVAMLRAVIKPPDDPAMRAEVAAVREAVARVKALADSGQCTAAIAAGAAVVPRADATRYLPLQAEAHLAIGHLGESCTDVNEAIGALEAATFAAEASRHDQVFIESTINLADFYSDRLHDNRRARDAWEHARAVLSRFPGHPVLEAWLADSRATLFRAEGRYEEALAEGRKALGLREATLGPSHYEVASSLGNMALDLHELGRDLEAERLMSRTLELLVNLFGHDSARVAMNLVNESEILTALGRLDEAGTAIDQGLSIWKRQHVSQFLIGYGLLDRGRLEIAEKQPTEAVATLEEALRLLADEDAHVTAQAKFALADALWAGSRRQSAAMARSAREMAARDGASSRLVAQIDAWQRDHSTR